MAKFANLFTGAVLALAPDSNLSVNFDPQRVAVDGIEPQNWRKSDCVGAELAFRLFWLETRGLTPGWGPKTVRTGSGRR